ncbi:hypothetical protein SUGI_0457760 [Cryptomeria japonica]|nr:hypothetical protein SUGI_0457760 [Cryptomeria japonica]
MQFLPTQCRIANIFHWLPCTFKPQLSCIEQLSLGNFLNAPSTIILSCIQFFLDDIPHHDVQNALKLSKGCNLNKIDCVSFMLLLIKNANYLDISHYISYGF